MKPYLKNKLKRKKIWGMDQVVKQLPSECKALSSIPTQYHQKKRKERNIHEYLGTYCKIKLTSGINGGKDRLFNKWY
jgi:hypothetical protein